MFGKTGLLVALGAICLVAPGVGIASAGEYHVYSCRMPNGEAAPTDGWSGSATGAAVHAEDTCAKGGALIAELGEGVSHVVGTDDATWTFSAPSATTFSKVNVWRAGDAEGGAVANATYEFWLAGPTEPEAFDSCVYVSGCMKAIGEPGDPLSASNMVPVPNANLGEHIYVNASCGGLQTYKCPSGKGDPNGYAAVVYLYAADLVLDQTSQPTVSDVEGELATASTLSGTADLAFHAADSGSGVYQAVFDVDGAEVGRTVLDSSSHCRDVGQTSDGLPAFLYLQPCSPALDADVPFDTTQLSDGTHHLVVSVTNAAGDSTVALDRKITVANHPQAEPPSEPPASETPASTGGGTPPASSSGPDAPSTAKHEQLSLQTTTPQSPPPTGPGAPPTLLVHWVAPAHAARLSAYGRSRVVSGRLASASGAPIAGAIVQVLSTPAFQGAPTRKLASARTGPGGAFSVRLPASLPSTRLTFAYSATPSQPAPNVSAQLELAVAARVWLRIAPRVTHQGGTIAFTGALPGPLPPGGKQVILEARALHGPWRQFQVLTTAAHGRFHSTYRFRLPGPIDYQFRAVCPHEADYPYATSSSPLVLVHER